jgi:hypothetical protein
MRFPLIDTCCQDRSDWLGLGFRCRGFRQELIPLVHEGNSTANNLLKTFFNRQFQGGVGHAISWNGYEHNAFFLNQGTGYQSIPHHGADKVNNRYFDFDR